MEIWIIENVEEKIALYATNGELIRKIFCALDGREDRWLKPVKITENEMMHKKAASWMFVKL